MKKRICAVILSLLLAVNLVGVPKAKAVVSEGALLGSIFGSLLVSMGFSLAADNMDAPTFGEAIYKLIQEFDEANKETGVQLIRDLNIAALTSGRPGTIQFNYAWTQAARSFAEWLQSKFLVDGNSASIGLSQSINIDGSFLDGRFSVNYPDYLTANQSLSFTLNSGQYCEVPFTEPCSISFAQSSFVESEENLAYIAMVRVSIPDVGLKEFSNGETQIRAKLGSNFQSPFSVSVDITQDDVNKGAFLYFVINGTSRFSVSAGETVSFSNATSLSTSVPLTIAMGDVHYPDVAEDGSQVYEVTYEGVTATDIEGIIQGAVDRILAGTAAIAGEVIQAQDVPVEPEAPAAGEYAVPGLETIFPFCIPFDIYAFCAALNADPVAPSFEWRMQYAPLDLDYTFVIDLEAFDGAARVLRTMELLAFCVGLAFWTRHLIRG